MDVFSSIRGLASDLVPTLLQIFVVSSEIVKKRRREIDEHRFVVSICGVHGVAPPPANIVDVDEARLPVLVDVQNGEGLHPSLVEDNEPEIVNLLHRHQHLSQCVVVEAEGAKLEF